LLSSQKWWLLVSEQSELLGDMQILQNHQWSNWWTAPSCEKVELLLLGEFLKNFGRVDSFVALSKKVDTHVLCSIVF
jgi:hypothetical protein